MIVVPMLLIFAGYTAASYGRVLLKGWDIPFSEWVNPLHPYQWPASGPPSPIPAGQLFPSAASAGSAAPATTGTGGRGTGGGLGNISKQERQHGFTGAIGK